MPERKVFIFLTAPLLVAARVISPGVTGIRRSGLFHATFLKIVLAFKRRRDNLRAHMKNEMLQKLQESISALEAVIAEPRVALDSCQYLVEMDLPAVDDIASYPAVYGEWPKSLGSSVLRRGFRSSDLAPHSLCGCILQPFEHGSLQVRDLHSLGYRSARLVHRDAFLQARLVKARKLLAGLQ